ncbi:MAG: carboxypeptidase regulatory-like domain-containing protein [Deltaproteobacteria bacterium]|nr:carboxypeptidase regulatory-like domain-containing protein [Deltaproteobacteria bacterium]
MSPQTVGAIPPMEKDGGCGQNGLVGVYHVGMLSERRWSGAIVGSTAYGIVESVGPVKGAHHGAYGNLAASFYYSSLFAAALNATGMIQYHPDDAQGEDRSFFGMPSLTIRSGYRVHPRFWAGAELRVMVPGARAPSVVWGGTSLDAVALGTFRLPREFRLGVSAGFRFDNSHKAAPDAALLRPGDRVAMPWSEFHFVPLGVSAVKVFGSVTGVAEISGEVLVGRMPVSVSPMRAVIGLRYAITEMFQIGGMNVVSLSQRPNESQLQQLFPVEPRYTFWLSGEFVWGLGTKTPLATGDGAETDKSTEREPVPEPPTETEVTPQKPEDAEPPKPVTGVLASTIRDENGVPAAGVEVVITNGDYQRTVITGRDGTFVVDDVPAGEVEIAVTVAFYEPIRWTAVVDVSGEVSQETVPPMVASEMGSQIRGLVRNLEGDGVVATVSVTPGNVEVATSENGEFQLNLQPGNYSVEILAPGYQPQKRRIRLGENSVEVLNIDLRPMKTGASGKAAAKKRTK